MLARTRSAACDPFPMTGAPMTRTLPRARQLGSQRTDSPREVVNDASSELSRVIEPKPYAVGAAVLCWSAGSRLCNPTASCSTSWQNARSRRHFAEDSRGLLTAIQEPATTHGFSNRAHVESVQIMRRLRALLEELRETVRPEHLAAVEEELRRLDA